MDKVALEGMSSSKKKKKTWKIVTLESGAASKFMSIVTNHILFKILLRLPNALSVIQCRTICKHWFSLFSHDDSIYSQIHSISPFLLWLHHFVYKLCHCSYKPDYVLLSKKSKCRGNISPTNDILTRGVKIRKKSVYEEG